MQKLYNVQPKFVKVVLMAMVMLFFVAPNALKAQVVDGSAENPIPIYNVEQLKALQQCVNTALTFYYDRTTGICTKTNPGANGFAISSGNANIHYKLMADIDLNPGKNVAGCDGDITGTGIEEWSPIGISGHTFCGQFDGNYHIISGVYINQPTKSDVGFFGMVVNNSCVRNLGIVNSYIYGGQKVGGIAGSLSQANVVHCFVDATIGGAYSPSTPNLNGRYVGGIVGHAMGGDGPCIIDTCYVVGSISSRSDHIGGIVGGSPYAYITSCYSSAIINYTAPNQIGGIMGYDDGTCSVTNCYYDRQMCPANTTYGEGKWTSDMVDESWQVLGENYSYAYSASNDQYYPSLKGFNQNNMAVRLSTLPVILSGEQTMADVRENFTVGGKNDGFSWISSDNLVAEVTTTALNYVVDVKKQGWIMLTARYGELTHTLSLYTTRNPAIGTEENPFTIDNFSDLTKFRDGINSGTPFIYKHYLIPARGANTYFKQTQHITLTGSWTGIGSTREKAFSGIYDGGGYEVQGMKVTSGTYVGFFSNIQFGTVKNLGVRIDQFTPSSYSGAICGKIFAGTIENCYACGNDMTLNGNYCGALVGIAVEDTVRIVGCHNECNITSSASYLGGIIGYSEDANYLLISHCYNSGNITGSENLSGGIMGYSRGTSTQKTIIEYCYNTGNISTTRTRPALTGDYFLGGIIGRGRYSQTTTISYCYNTGNITARVSAAGICGYYASSVDHCYNTGNILLKDVGQNSVDLACGIAYSTTVTNSLNLGNITVERGGSAFGITNSRADYCFNAGEIYCGDPANGYVAYALGSNGNSRGNINVGRLTGYITYAGSGSSSTYSGSCFYDSQMSGYVYAVNGSTAKTTSQMLGTALQTALGDQWVYTAGMYPRIKGLENEDAMIVAASPVLLATGNTVNAVSNNFSVNGCDSSVVWTKDGDLVTAITGCTNNTSNVTVAENPVAGATTLTATRNGFTKTVQLYSAANVSGVLTIDSVADLRAMRDGVNSGAPFVYKSVLVPAGAKNTTFRQTTNLDLSTDINWEPIGTADMPFQGQYDGNSDTISNLTQSGMMFGGLFGFTRHANIHHLSLANINIAGNSSNAGAFIANSGYQDTLAYCYALSGSISGHNNSGMVEYTFVGGLVGYSVHILMSHCGNHCPVTGIVRTYVGGLVGRGVNDGTHPEWNLIDHCYNKGDVTGDYYVGGLSGYALRVSNSYNAGDVTGGVNSECVGGIGTYDTYVSHCFNTGKVTAQQRAAGVSTFVGGLVAYLYTNNARVSVEYSYNTGIVDGANRMYVGGIVGYARGSNNHVVQNYNANAVIGTGEYVGSIVGNNASNSNKTNNYYDYTFSQIGGVNNADVAGVAESKRTADMVGDGLSTLFTAAQWTFASGYYPRIPDLATDDASYASAAELLIPNNDLANAVPTGADLTLGGCADEVTWALESGNSITFDNDECEAHVARLGVVYVTASKNSFPYKFVKINAGVSESSPLVIKSKAELIKFRNYINNGVTFYYRDGDSTFHATDEGGYFAVTNQGADLYFKLNCDVDLSDTIWVPIGLSEAGKTFDGHFSGANHTITGMQLTGNGDYKGFFGYLNNGSISDLNITKSKLSGTGSYKGFVCGFNNTGAISNCNSTLDTIKTGNSGNSWGAICGFNLGSIKECTGTNDTIATSVTKVGGICGYGRMGSIDECQVQNLKFYSTASQCGGICGQVNKNRIQDCHTLNSTFVFEGGQYCGGVCGLDTASNILHCSFENSTIDATHRYIGGIAGYCYAYTDAQNPTGANQYVRNCHSKGGHITTTGTYAAGICGVTNTSTYTRMLGCYNETPVQAGTYAGGLIAGGGFGIDSCYNTASITTTTGGYCGGLVGNSTSSSSNIWHSFNIGDVTCKTNYAGGLIGYNQCTRIYMSFNSGKVVGSDYVGGLVGLNYGGTLDSYNAGQVYGGSYVGGISGQKATNIYSGNSSRLYNIGHVQGNSIAGAISGFIQNESSVSNCFYDKQFSYSVGVNGADIAGKAEGKLTNEMLADALSATLGTVYTASSTNYDTWMYVDGTYPQLKYIHDRVWGLDASVVTATPIVLPNDDITSWTIPSGTSSLVVYGGGGSDVVWSAEAGTTALEIPDGTNFTIRSAGVVTVQAAAHDSIYKKVRLLIGISEESPILITNYTELYKFDTNINKGNVFYYDVATRSFWGVNNDEFTRIQIPAGGEGMFFRLENDIDMGVYDGTWTPIGKDENNLFSGNFNGNNKTITGMVVDNSGGGNNHGFFGYSSGSIKNLTIANANVIGSNYTGALCGYNKGTIIHCGVVGGTVTGSSTYTGGVCGYSKNGSISECYNSSVVSGKGRVGGVVGRIDGGVTQQCFNMGMVSSSMDYCGGIAGQNSSYLSDSYNTGIITGTSGANYVGGVTGSNEAAQFKRVYNAGYVVSDGTTYGGLTTATSSTNFPSNSACDSRMSPAAGVVSGLDPNSQTKLTEQMVGDNLQTLLGDEFWTYSDSLYPQLTAFVGEDASYVSVSPLFFKGAQTVLDLTSPFMAYNKNGVNWAYVVPTDVVNLSTANQPESGRVTVENCGPVSLKVTKALALRQIDLVVQNVSAGEDFDTTCGEAYEWQYNHRFYDITGDYIEPVEIGPGCNQITTLHLIVPEPLAFHIESGDVVCYGNNDGYVNPNVSGCFGTYTYEWSKEGDATFSSTASILTNLGPGKYYVTVTDATKTNCKLTDSVVIAEPTELVVSNDFADSHCFNDNDGELSFEIAGGIAPYSITWTTPSAGSATQSLAGTYSMSGLPDGTYDFTVMDANNCTKTMDIEVADDETPYAITAYGIEKLYDGVEVNPNRYVLKIADGTPDTLTAGVPYILPNDDTLKVTVSQTAPLVNAGVTANNLLSVAVKRGTEDVTCRYNIIQNNSFVTINKRNVTITSNTAQKPWDGDPLISRDTTISGDGFAAGEGVDITWDPEHSSQTNAGASYNQFTYEFTAATNEANYIITPVFGLLTVTAEGTLVVSGVSVTKTYDGEPIQADYVVSGLKSGHHLEIGYSVGGSSVPRPTLTDAGTVTYDLFVGVFFDGTNADASSQYDSIAHNTGTLTINKLPIGLTSNTKTKVYDGTELYDHEVSVSGDDNHVFRDNISDLQANAHDGTSYVTVVNYTPTAVTNKISFTAGSEYNANNYDITYNQGTLSITKKSATYTGEKSTEPYTGAEQCLTGITSSGLLTGHTLSGVTYSACGTDAGIYIGSFSGTPVVMNGSADVTENYTLTPVTDTLTIQGSTKEIVITSASMTDEYYDATTHTKQEYTVTYGGTNIAAVEGTDGKKFALPTNDTITITPTNDGAAGVTNVLAAAVTNDFDYVLQNATNYLTPTTSKGTLNLLPRTIVIRSKSWTQAYTGQQIRKDEITIAGMGFPSGQGIDASATNWSQMEGVAINVGSYENKFDYELNSSTNPDNYDITKEYGTITVTKQTLTVTADNKTRTYGDENPTLTYTMSGFVNNENEADLRSIDQITGTPSVTTEVTNATGIGSGYVITITKNDLAATNYDFYFVNGTFAITARQIHINALPVSVTYDGHGHTWEESAAPHYEIPTPSELRTGDEITNVVITGSARNAGANTGAISATSATIKNGDDVDVSDNYQMVFGTAGIAISKKNLKITVHDGTHQYDGQTHGADAIPTPQYEIDHVDTLAETDEIEVINFTGGGSAVSSTPYPVTVDLTTLHIANTELSNHLINMKDNYEIEIVSGGVTITSNTTPIVITSATQAFDYDGTSHTKNVYTVTENSVNVAALDGTDGLQFKLSTNDIITITPTFTGITNVVDNAANNNTFTYVLQHADQYSDVTTVYGAVSINPVEITLAADDKTKVYDNNTATDPALTATVTGKPTNGVDPVYTLSREPGQTVGDYAITLTAEATANPNYTLSSITGGTFSITKAALTIKLDTAKTYNGEVFVSDYVDQTDGYTITGLQGTATITNGAVTSSGSAVGTYIDSASTNSASITTDFATSDGIGNYEVTYDFKQVINKAEITITAEDKTKQYDNNAATDPALTAVVTGAPADGVPPVYSLSRVAGQNAGDYAITVTAEADDNPNYTVNTVAGNFSITKAPLTIKLDTTKNYDGAVFVSNYAAATDGYTITGLQGTATITAGTVTSSGSGAGTYVDSASTNYASITVDFATSDGIDNYDVTYDFKQVIIKADLTITINATKEYDQTALTVPYDSAIVSVEGLMSGDALTAGVVTTNAVDAATYTHTGGTVNITTDFATTLGIDNYEVTYNVALIITPRTGVVVTVQEHGAEYEYDGSTHSADGYSVSIDDPLYQTSDFTFSGTASVTGTGTETGLNFYPMTLSASNFTNTNPNFTNVTFTILDSALYIYPKLKATVTSVTGVSCPGATNGTATINVTGGKPTSGEYSFSLDGGLAEAFTAPHLFENLSAGSHTVVVTDSLNYTATANFTIDELEILTATIVTPTDLCPNQGNYPVSVNVTGGSAPYTYTWTGAQDVDAPATEVVQTEVNDGGTTYTVSVSILDANSCPVEANATFTVKPSVTKSTSLSDIVCPADMDVTMRYGVYDTLLTLTEPTWTSNITEMPLTLVNDAPASSRFGVREGREDSTYTIHWHLVDTCGGDSLICTQTIIVRFPECSSVTAEGHTYQAVRLGANCWTRSNLVTPVPPTRSSLNGEYKYNNDDALAAQFGLLYSWYAACHLPEGSSADPVMVDGHVQGLCPDGWALPTADDYIIMVESIGGVPHMKTTESDFWVSGLEGTAPSSGFDALGAGFYNSATDSFEGLLTVARFWTATPTGSSNTGTAIQCAICEGEEVIIKPKGDAFSVRCVRVQ